MDSWMKTQQDMINGDTKAVGCTLSAEFLMGKQLRNALLNAGLTPQFEEAVRGLGFDPQAVVDAEYEPGWATAVSAVSQPASSIRSPRSAFPPSATASSTSTASSARNSMTRVARSSVRTTGCPMSARHIDYERDQRVNFGGKVVEENGKRVWKPSWAVRAIPVDYMVPGYASGRVNTLRLWQARSYDEFDLLTFNKSEHLDAVKPQVKAEDISKVPTRRTPPRWARNCVSNSSTSSPAPPFTMRLRVSPGTPTSRI